MNIFFFFRICCFCSGLLFFNLAAMESLANLFGDLKIEETVDRGLRVKITNNCPFSCNFCHNEGTEPPSGNRTSIMLDTSIKNNFDPVGNISVPDIEDVVSKPNPFFPYLKEFKEMGYTEIHLTGGEPTSLPKILQLIRIVSVEGFVVKLTSNGQFKKEKLKEFKEVGLSGITFSVLSLDPAEFLTTQLRQYSSRDIALKYAKRAIKNVCDNIVEAKKVGLNVKINAIVLDTKDTSRTDKIIEFAQQNNIKISLLPCVLSSNPTSSDKEKMEKFTFDYVLKKGATYIKTVLHTNVSSGSHEFVLKDGTSLQIKIIRQFQPKILCEGCEHFGKASCAENFYGLRIEYRGGKPFVRLCVQRSDQKTLMPLDDFLKNKQLCSLLPVKSLN